MKRVVTIGGGTGTFVVLSGLKRIPDIALTALVSSADDGGSTGRLRDAYGILPVGDARQALVALAEDETSLRDLFNYRFAKGDIAGHNLGNLLLTALSERLGSEDLAMQEASRILRVKGSVSSTCSAPTTLVAELTDGTTLRGEHLIDERDASRPKIKRAYLEAPCSASPVSLSALKEADAIVLCPGDLYTSIAATLLADRIREAIASSRAKLICIVNLFTKAGQTTGFNAKAHVEELERYAGRKADHILIHANGGFEPAVLEKYAQEGEWPVSDDLGEDVRVIRAPLASVHTVPSVPEDPVPRSLIRHDSDKLRTTIEPLLA